MCVKSLFLYYYSDESRQSRPSANDLIIESFWAVQTSELNVLDESRCNALLVQNPRVQKYPDKHSMINNTRMYLAYQQDSFYPFERIDFSQWCFHTTRDVRSLFKSSKRARQRRGNAILMPAENNNSRHGGNKSYKEPWLRILSANGRPLSLTFLTNDRAGGPSLPSLPPLARVQDIIIFRV